MYSLKIVNDPNPENPRNWDNLGVTVCTHKRYNLGNSVSFPFGNYNSWVEVEDELKRKYKAVIILPLYLYDHSGITISTNPFNCKWDSGQVGFIYTTKQRIREYFGCKYITETQKTIARHQLLNEVDTYDHYLTGECYGWEITNLETGRVDESGYGYFDKEVAQQDGEELLCHLQEFCSS